MSRGFVLHEVAHASNGDLLRVDLTAANPGPEGFLDVFVGIVLPADVSAALGHPGPAAVFLTDGFQQGAPRCLTASPATFPPPAREMRLPANVPPPPRPGLPSARGGTPACRRGPTWSSWRVTAEAFADGPVDPGDVVATAAFTVLP